MGRKAAYCTPARWLLSYVGCRTAAKAQSIALELEMVGIRIWGLLLHANGNDGAHSMPGWVE